VLTAPGGGAELEIARREQRIDLLLSDVVMPEMLGPEVARRVTAIRPDVKVLYMSGYVHQAIGGADPALAEDIAFIEKPFNAETLLTGVRAALDAETAAART
jgi:DNA-binding NtrC family response regulator